MATTTKPTGMKYKPQHANPTREVFLYRAALLCKQCGEQTGKGISPQLQSEDSDRWPQGPHGDGGGEADSLHHCDMCGCFLENPLTSLGLEETLQRFELATYCTETLEQWAKYLEQWYSTDELVRSALERYHKLPPAKGLPVTVYVGNDTYPATVIETGKTVRIRFDEFVRTDSNGRTGPQTYDYFEDVAGDTVKIFKSNSRGWWKVSKQSTRAPGCGVSLGTRLAYRCPDS